MTGFVLAGRVAMVADGPAGLPQPFAYLAIYPHLYVAGITATSPAVVQSKTAHGLVNGQTVTITADLEGATQAVGTWFATVVDATHFSIPVSVTTPYVAAGSVTRLAGPGLAVLYVDETKDATASNPTQADFLGNYQVVAVPGDYDAVLNGVLVTFPVPPTPSDIAASGDLTALSTTVGGNTSAIAANATAVSALASTSVQITEGLTTDAAIVAAAQALVTSEAAARSAADAVRPTNLPTVYNDFTTKPPGSAAGAIDSSQTPYIDGANASNCVIQGGQLTLNPLAANLTAYWRVAPSLTNQITRIGCRAFLTAGTTETPAIGLNLWTTRSISDSCAHLDILVDHWTYGVWISGVFTIVAQRSFSNLLPIGVPLDFDLTVDQPNGRAFFREPSGVVQPISDPLIRTCLPGYYATWELNMVAATDFVVGYELIWADNAIQTLPRAPQADVGLTMAALGRIG